MIRLTDGLKRIDQLHEAGGCFYDAAKERSGVRYAWHNPLLPPEYRRRCLNGKAAAAEPQYDIYYFTACFYEKLTGSRAPYDFEINRTWKEILKKRMEGWDAEYQENVLRLIETCTRTRRHGSWNGK